MASGKPGADTRRKRFGLVLCPRFPLLSLALCTESLRLANRELGRRAYQPVLLTENGGPATASSGIALAADARLEAAGALDRIIVLASYAPAAACTPGLLAWLRKRARAGAPLAAVDTGILVLARAGLVADQPVAAHRETAPAFAADLADVVWADAPTALSPGLASSAGGVATLDMMLGLIAAEDGPALAARIAQILNHAWDGSTSTPVAGGAETAAARIDRRLGAMMSAIRAAVDAGAAPRLAHIYRDAGMEPSTARRLFKRRLGLGPRAYTTRLRLDRARRLLAHSAMPVAAVAAEAGYGDPSAFARAYRAAFGVPPSQDRAAPSGAAM